MLHSYGTRISREVENTILLDQETISGIVGGKRIIGISISPSFHQVCLTKFFGLKTLVWLVKCKHAKLFERNVYSSLC